MADAKPDTNSRIFALRAAGWIGCSGAHKHDGKWMPCETHEELQRISGDAEPKRKSSYAELQNNFNIRKAKGKKTKKKGWEKLRETKPLGGFATLEGGGIVSAPINNMIPMGRSMGSKSYIPGVSPRDNDPDVFTDIESARKRSRMLGCIGVRRMPSSSGRTIWMPCTSNSDYSRLAGTTFLGRSRQADSSRRAIRTIVRSEIAKERKTKPIRGKSLHFEMNEIKGIGDAIGRTFRSRSVGRKMRRALSQIPGVLNPLERRDRDGDGLIFDGTWHEMPDPNVNRNIELARGARSRSDDTREGDGYIENPVKRKPEFIWQLAKPAHDGGRPTWVAKQRNEWFKPSKVKKGGPLKAADLLNFDRIRLRKNREEQARALGVTPKVIDKLHEPDASIDPNDADKLVMRALDLHPALVWGRAWLELPSSEKRLNRGKTGKKRGRALGPFDERDKKILEMKRNGKTINEIAKELNVSRNRVNQLIERAQERKFQEGEREWDAYERGDARGARSGSNPINRPGQIPRDERGNILPQEDVRAKVIKANIQKLKDLGLSDEEINFLMTGDAGTPVEPRTPQVDARQINRDARRDGARSMSISELEKVEPSTWPQHWKRHIVDWANSKPSFNVPYSLAQKQKQDGELSNNEWKRLLYFYKTYGPETGRGARSTSENANDYKNVGGRRMGQIILDRVGKDFRNKPPGKRTHHHVVGPGGMGKTTLRKHLTERQLLPKDTEAAVVDPDFIKMGIEGYEGGTGSVAVHRQSAHAATHTVNDARKNGMDIVTEGTGYRLLDYETTADNTYKKIVHIAYAPYDVAEKRIAKRNAEGKRQLPISQIRQKGGQLYGWLTNHLRRGEIQDMYIWDTDVPEGAAPQVIGKIVDGVFHAIDESKFKQWADQHGAMNGGDVALDWFKRRYPQK